MSLIKIHDQIIESEFNKGGAYPKDTFNLQQRINLARHLDSCSNLMQYDSYTELLLKQGGRRKRGRKSRQPFFPLKEEVKISKVKIPNYVGFSCKHYQMLALLRYDIDPDFMRMFV